jgi:hypothetical protein
MSCGTRSVSRASRRGSRPQPRERHIPSDTSDQSDEMVASVALVSRASAAAAKPPVLALSPPRGRKASGYHAEHWGQMSNETQFTTAESLEAAMRRALTESGINEVTAGGEFTLPAHRPTLFPGVDEGRDHDEQRALRPCCRALARQPRRPRHGGAMGPATATTDIFHYRTPPDLGPGRGSRKAAPPLGPATGGAPFVAHASTV